MSLYHNAIFVSKKEDMPQQEHWAILKFTTIHIPGDERSRTHPGHGYPAGNEPVVKYEAYLMREDWEAAIQELEKERIGSPQYVAVKVSKPATTTVRVDVIEEA